MKTHIRSVILPLALLALPLPSFATLGEPLATVERDRQSLKSTHAVTTKEQGTYSVQEITTSGNTIKEFVAPNGTVFAVSWRGVGKPDLSSLLGTYASEYRDQLESSPKQPGRRHVNLRSSRLVIQHSGHMRDLHGFVYDPSLVPSGVRIEDLQ